MKNSAPEQGVLLGTMDTQPGQSQPIAEHLTSMLQNEWSILVLKMHTLTKS